MDSTGGPSAVLPGALGHGDTALPKANRLSSGELERMLLEARRLVESAVDRHRTEEWLLTALEPNEGTGAVERTIDSAERSLSVVLSGCSDEEIAWLIPRLGRAVGRGVDVRLLAWVGLLENRSFVDRLDKYAPRVDVRLVREPLQETVLADGTLSVAWSRPGPSSRETVVVRAPAVLRNLRTLFQVSWKSSPTLADHRRLSDHMRGAVARRILLALSSGRTDEVAARDLSMSVRTYRRYVAEITRELGANSRFQAGARAVELGLLPASVEGV
ncbi:hypothetical protein ACMA1D_09010 [Streptomyces sp. 796.1]|uniref:hypothetical protein n=1 Tax=Streptomyces sp. 796.1 TaxID=3163029 RepID=UPI0039C90CFA